ncbi:MAG: 4-(cytidine 5'-diphospho)-2-C-methyl-D-erythritol kinase [Janthinobacterium lividum]
MTGYDMPLVERAHAKINLYLHVVGRRDDGYHLLDSLAVFAGAHDVLTAEPRVALSLDLAGPFARVLRDEDVAGNLVIRAARLLQADAGTEAGAAIRLDKNLPIASGIGGGSADAAAALRLLHRLWDVDGVDEARLATIASSLGADVPVCLSQRPARMGGVGEELGPAPVLPDCFMVLVNCGVAVSTPAVFRARAPGFRAPADLPGQWTDVGAMADDLSRLANDLEPAAIALCPPIAGVLAAIAAQPGCRLARMSGSGATCFGLFAAEHEALDAAQALARPAWWVWGGPLAGF